MKAFVADALRTRTRHRTSLDEGGATVSYPDITQWPDGRCIAVMVPGGVRLALHLARCLSRAIEALPEAERIERGLTLAHRIVDKIERASGATDRYPVENPLSFRNDDR